MKSGLVGQARHPLSTAHMMCPESSLWQLIFKIHPKGQLVYPEFQMLLPKPGC